jgi:hypothetical protein
MLSVIVLDAVMLKVVTPFKSTLVAELNNEKS